MNIRRDFICLIAILFCGLSGDVMACSPAPDYSSDPEYLKAHADHIFLGRVRSVSVNEGSSRVTIKFQVSRVWKGSRKSVRTVKTFVDESVCGFGSDFFVKGKTYLVYADQSKQGITTTTLSGSKESGDAKDDLTYLGRGRKTS